jgi:hypothetical protein
MKDAGLIALVTLAALGFVAAAVFGLEDRSVLSPPPDAVAESFVRELGMARYELAHHYLSKDVRQHVSASDLRASFQPLQAHTGPPDQVITHPSSENGNQARVLATLEGRRETASMYVDLVRERGLWKVATWPLDVVAK